MWRARIDQEAAAGSLGDLERDVLADYWVTDEEYACARERLPACIGEHGFIADLSAGGGFSVAPDPAFWNDLTLEDAEVEAAMNKAVNECQESMDSIEAYYWDMRSRTRSSRWQRWSRRSSLPSAGRTRGHWRRDVSRWASLMRADEGHKCGFHPPFLRPCRRLTRTMEP